MSKNLKHTLGKLELGETGTNCMPVLVFMPRYHFFFLSLEVLNLPSCHSKEFYFYFKMDKTV